ncbi:hypothetical protein [Halorubrum rubrum]
MKRSDGRERQLETTIEVVARGPDDDPPDERRYRRGTRASQRGEHSRGV